MGPPKAPELTAEQGQHLVQANLSDHERSLVTKAVKINNYGFR